MVDSGVTGIIKVSIEQGKKEGDKLAQMIKDVKTVV